ncbi:hypothetical protein SAMN05428969_2813 [Devosia sp. YR412]|uniref:hypothetical protein n=1 Tax=Devosia sp. YR412 TaxID=1881030 RepID=UPI0008B1196E|nr:hypothetical protein [Devosia sp. YR412]SEQ37598.1 hypothetical protein SAMN05428969_2813 [Devosia sp. YR412]
MFVQNDSVSEVIAHFIGHFELATEQARLRIEHQKFQHEARGVGEGELPYRPTDFNQRLDLDPYMSGVSYRPPVEALRGFDRPNGQDAGDALRPGPDAGFAGLPDDLDLPGFRPVRIGGEPGPLEGPIQGSVAMVAEQKAILYDDDIMVMPGGVHNLSLDAVDFGRYDMMVADAANVAAALKGLTLPDGGAGIAEFITAAAEIAEAYDSPSDDVVVIKGEAVGGMHVDGEVVDELPELDDHLPEHLTEDYDGSTAVVVEGEGANELVISQTGKSGTMDVDAGGNSAINAVGIVNAGMAPTFLAVMGDYHDFNAIIQTNIWSDWDVTRITDGHNAATASGTLGFNIANVMHETRDAAGDRADAKPDVFPGNWMVSVIQGDVTFLSWIDQFSFKSDNDILVLTASGSTTTITSGENLSLNATTFGDLGLYYDLVIIGGSLYDANIICQTNVLYDDDAVSILMGGNDTASVSTGGNLLWNQASITNVGPAAWEHGVPDSYRDAADTLSSGGRDMPDSVRHEATMEGFAGLRVLYISGNVYDLQYVKQTNVICDADTVAIAADLAANGITMDWDVSTGSNALVNVATIHDFDSIGAKGYVGGEVYSDAILIQAELVMPAHSDGQHPLDSLVSEAVAFLVDAEDLPALPEGTSIAAIASDAPPVDVMQSVLA